MIKSKPNSLAKLISSIELIPQSTLMTKLASSSFKLWMASLFSP